MKVCIPSLDGRGLEAAVASHFGSAPVFTLVDVETRRTDILTNDPQHGDHTGCHASGRLRRLGVDAVLCRGMGRRAFTRFSEDGIAVFVVQGGRVTSAVDALCQGRATLLTADAACAGGQGLGCGDVPVTREPHHAGR